MKRMLTAVLALTMTVLGGCGSAPMHMDESFLAVQNEPVEAPAPTETPEPPTTEPTTEATTEPPTEPPTTEPVIPPAEEIDGEIVFKNGVMVVNSGTDHARAIELYVGNPDVEVRYAEILNQFRERLPEDTSVYCMVVPTSAAYYIPEDQAEQYGDQNQNYENIAANLKGVTGVPLYNALLYHRNEPIYSRTDYHWQPLGAYYAAAELAKAADVPFAPLEGYDRVEREGYVGAFASLNNISELWDEPEVFTYYKPANLDRMECRYYNNDFTNERSGNLFHEDNDISASYTVFVGTDDCIFQADTDVNNGRVLVIFKDSYGNALLPFLTESFSTIYLCDYRYFNTDAAAFVENIGATDVLFALSSVACATSAKMDTLSKTLGE